MIIDSHVHILNAEDAHLSELLRAADRARAECLCISSLSRVWTPNPDAAALEEAFGDIEAACAAHPGRFHGFVYVSADHVDLSLALMERGIAQGPCRLVKLWISQFADDPRLDPIYTRAIELKAAVMMHTWTKATGNLPNESTLHHAVRVARRYPELRVWAAHYGGRWEEAARIVAAAPSLHLDISGGEVEDGIVDTLMKHLPAERVFFGSDAPGRVFEVQMAKVDAANLTAAQRALILGGNIQRWLHD